MLIKKLTLTDFRQFIGTQEISFSTDKDRNVTVLIGANTSGKTTFVRAFEWVLYGTHEFGDVILLNQNIVDNMQVGETHEVVGIITLEHNGKEYEIIRKQTYTCIGEKKVRESLKSSTITYLQPDGQTKTPIGSDFDSNIERILPRALSNYFFFDGERVKIITEKKDIENSIKGLMGLDVLSNAMDHLRSVINRLRKSMDFSGDQNARTTQSKLESAIIKRKDMEEELEKLNDEIDYYQEEKGKYAALLKANEGTAVAQQRREQLDSIISSLTDRVAKDKKELVSLFSRNSFTFFSIPLLKRSIEILEKSSDNTESVPEMTAVSIDYILKRGICICGTHISDGSAAQKNLEAEKRKQPPESIGSLVRRYREQAVEYLSTSDNYYSSIESKFSDIRATQRDLGFRIDEQTELSKNLSGIKDVAVLEQEYKNADQKIKKMDALKTRLNEQIGACKKDIDNYERALESYGKANERNTKISLNIDYATAVFEWVGDAYKTREMSVRSKLEQKVNANFIQMYHGSRNITIDEKYRVKYIDVTTEESEGLKAVKSFAFVAGLVDLAKEALSSDQSIEADVGPQYYPLVMDAPFSNVDETHIQNVSKILPHSAEQVIIAVMQKDWEPASEIMKKVVGKSYIITKDVDADGKPIDTISHIKRGEMYV